MSRFPHEVNSVSDDIRSSDVVLVLMGQEWSGTSAAPASHASIYDADTENRIHIQIGIALEGKVLVVAILVDEVPMPSTNELPTRLKALAASPAIRVRDANLESDFDYLLTAIRCASC
jgi:hypothetical protein